METHQIDPSNSVPKYGQVFQSIQIWVISAHIIADGCVGFWVKKRVVYLSHKNFKQVLEKVTKRIMGIKIRPALKFIVLRVESIVPEYADAIRDD